MRPPVRARAAAKLLLVLASLGASLLLGELAIRTLLSPADYLSVTTARDDVLGIVVPAGTRGFDRWGFRNRDVPPSADVVALGDSHTYGNGATMAESWPHVVGTLTRRTVYNFGLGGYGPNQYYHLLVTRALALTPRWAVCALYMGDDFENAFLMTYGRDHWSFLRQGSFPAPSWDIWEASAPPRWDRRVRAWFSRNSVLYQVAVHGPLLGPLKGGLQIARASQAHDPSTATLVVRDAGIREAFRPAPLRARLDQHSAAVREGMRITFELLSMMKGACRAGGCRLAVVVIPTKETVFADHLLRDPELRLKDVIADLIRNEAEARRRVSEALAEAGIPLIDVLPALRGRLGESLYARSDRDMHPNKNGYRIIGEAVAAFLGEGT